MSPSKTKSKAQKTQNVSSLLVCAGGLFLFRYCKEKQSIRTVFVTVLTSPTNNFRMTLSSTAILMIPLSHRFSPPSLTGFCLLYAKFVCSDDRHLWDRVSPSRPNVQSFSKLKVFSKTGHGRGLFCFRQARILPDQESLMYPPN